MLALPARRPPIRGADLLERRVAAPTPPAPSLSVPAAVPGSSVLAAASSAPHPDPFLPVPSPSVSGTQHGVDAMTASLTLCTDAYVPTAVALTSLEDALQRARERVVEGSWPNDDLFHYVDQILPAQVTPWTEVIVVVGHNFHHQAAISRWLSVGHTCSAGSPPPLVLFVPVCAVYEGVYPGASQVLPQVMECARCFLPSSHILVVTERVMPGLFPNLADLWQIISGCRVPQMCSRV